MEGSKQFNKFRDLKKSLPPLSKSNDLFSNYKQEDIRMKMAELIKEMAENGLNPKLIFGKGNVQKQRERYKKRVLEEQRFKCAVCNKVFSCNSSLKHHTTTKICEKPVKRTELEKEYHKQYYEKNKEKILEQKKQDRERQKMKTETSENFINVVYNAALGECGVQYYPEGM